MQTTLLGIAGAIILALLAALIAPLFVDWTQFRPVFEAEASRIVGLPVRVTGTIDARILPSPSLTLHGLEIGTPNSEQALHAQSLRLEFALGPLLRGEFRAAEAQLSRPEITIAVNDSGLLQLPKLGGGVEADALSIERLNIEDGTAHLLDAATGSRLTLDKFWFNGDLRSLAGPFRGEGAFVNSGELYGYRISAGRLNEGALRLRLNIDPSDRLLTAEADGSLTVGDARPRFEGIISLSRPAGLITATGKTNLEPPWRLTSQVSAGAGGVKFDRVDFLYGQEESGAHLTGTADLRFGKRSVLKAVVSARQLDLDRLIATPDNPTRLPADALRTLIGKFAVGLVAPVATELSFSADTVTLGGAAVQLFGADMRLENHAWTLDRVEFRAPGSTQVNLSGRLDVTPTIGFSGPVNIESNDPSALAYWLDGQKDPAIQIRPLKLRGEFALGQEQVSVDRLKAEIDHKALEGRLRYAPARGGHPSRLDADLSAPELDFDPLLAFFEAVRPSTALQPPNEIVLGIAVGRAKVAGIEAQDLRAKLSRDAQRLQIEQLSVADLGGALVNAVGQVDTTGAAPRGSLVLDVEARDLGGVIALAGRFAPQAADPLRRAAARVAGGKLRVSLALDGPATPSRGAMSTAQLAAEGRIGGLRASIHGQVREDSTVTASQGIVAGFSRGDVRLEAQLDGEDGGALAALLGLDKVVAVGKQPGFVNLLATGKPSDVLKVEARIVAGALDAKAAGTARISGEQGPSADLQVDIAKADIRPLVGSARYSGPLPLALHGWLALSDQSAKLDSMTATLAGTEMRGAVRLGFGSPLRVSGEIEAEALDAAAVVATAIGVPPSQTGRGGAATPWSAEPYGPGEFADLDGSVDLKILRAGLTPSLLARQVQAKLTFRGAEIALDKFDAHVAGGRVTGRLSFRRSKDGLMTQARIDAAGLDLAGVMPSDTRPPIGGRLTGKLELEAVGLSPRALIGSVTGSGTIRIDDGYFAGLDPKAFETIIRASDQGLAAGTSKIHDVVAAALNSGLLRIPRIETTLTINAGQVRPANTVAVAVGADLTATGSFDLTQQQIDARLTLTGMMRTDASTGRPDIFIGLRGPLAAPQKTIDVSALAGWLTIRHVEQQAKKLEALEAARWEAEAKEAAAREAAAREAAARQAAAREAAAREAAAKETAAKEAAAREAAAKEAAAKEAAAKEAAAKEAAARPGPEASVPSAAATGTTAAPSQDTGSAKPPAEARVITPPQPLTLAPALPAAREIRRIPRQPESLRGITPQSSRAPPGMPLWLPGAAQPSVMDSLVGTPLKR